MLGDQLLVGGHQMAAGSERPPGVVERGIDAADQLDDDLRVRADLVEVALAARQDADDLRPPAAGGLDRAGPLADELGESAADRPGAQQPDPQRLAHR